MTPLTQLTAKYIKEALNSLDEARYRLSCSITACTQPHPAESLLRKARDNAASLHTLLENILEQYQPPKRNDL